MNNMTLVLLDSKHRQLRSGRAAVLSAGILSALFTLYLCAAAVVLVVSLTTNRASGVAQTPRDEGINAEQMRFPSKHDRIPIAGWHLRSSGTRVIVLIHGIDSHGWHGSQPDLAKAYVAAGFNVLSLDLRGHGHSGGDRLGLGWHERDDVRAAVDALVSRGFKPGAIGIHGLSYGAATALLATAAIPEIGSVIADSSFSDVSDLMVVQIASRTGLPAWFTGLLVPGIETLSEWLYGLDLKIIAPVRALAPIAPRPVLFIHGNRDTVIPVTHARRLKFASSGPADELWVLDGFAHTEGIRMGKRQERASPMRERYLAKVTGFFDRTLTGY